MIKFGFILLILPSLAGCIVFPLMMVERPEIVGSIKDVDGKPIPTARVTIIGRHTVESIIEDYELDSVQSDKDGQFLFTRKNRIDWVHGYKFLARSPCSRRLNIEAAGFVTQRVKIKHQGKYNHLSDNVCKNVQFKINVVLEQQLTSSHSTRRHAL